MSQRKRFHHAHGRWAWTLAVAVIAGTSPGSIVAQNPGFERQRELFQLFTNCEPLVLAVTVEDAGEEANGLDEEAVSRAARSRLRSARQYTESGLNLVSIEVHIVGYAFAVDVELWKTMFDPVTEQYNRAVTWQYGSTGTHGGNGTYVVSQVQGVMDVFLDEYLRVNEPACLS
ncbi:MAG: hypothetical protein OXU74_03700 [Gemmatimonadota bacterium]|nr:hypothetical protein [Gemmatimonadota bacterium]